MGARKQVSKEVPLGRSSRAEILSLLTGDEDFLQRALDVGDEMFVILDAKGVVALINERGAELLGYRRREVVGKDWFENFIPPRNRSQVKKVFRKLMSGQAEPVEFYENPVYTGQGCERLISWHNKLIKDDSDAIIGILSAGSDVTELRRIEESHEVDEVKYRTLFETASDAVFIEGLDGEILDCNHAATALFGYSRKKLFSMNARELLPPSERDDFPDFQSELLRTGLLSLESQGVDKDGRVFPTDVRTQLMGFGGRQLAVVFLRDISERRRSERELVESEERFRAIYEKTSLGVVFTREGRFISANPAFCRMLGYSERELQDMSLQDITYHEDLKGCLKDLKRLDEGRSTGFRKEKRYVRKDGEIVYAVTSATNMHDDAGNLLYGLVFVEDVTERKNREKALLESEEKFRDLFENANDMIKIIGVDGRIIDANKKELKTMGYGRKDYVGKHVIDVIHPGHREETAGEVFRLLAGKSIKGFETAFITSKGRTVWVEVNATARKKDGRVVEARAISRDTTEKKRAEEKVRESEKRFRTAFNSSPSVVGLSTFKDGKYLDVNRMFTRVLGWGKKEVLGKTSKELGIFQDHKSRNKMARLLKKKGKISNLEVPVKTKSGKAKTLLFSAEVIDSGGEKRILAQANDITGRKKAEESLRESEERLKSITDNADDYIFIKDEKRRYSFANPAMCLLTGLPENEVVGKTANQVFGRRQGRVIKEIDDRTFSGETVNEVRRLEVDGETYYFNTLQTPLEKEDGRVKSILGIVRDVTTEKKAQEELNMSLQASDDLVKSMPTGIYIYQWEKPGKLILIDANKTAEKLTGVKLKDWRGREFNEIWPNAEKDGITKAYMKAFKSGKPYETESIQYEDDNVSGAFKIRAFRIPATSS